MATTSIRCGFASSLLGAEKPAPLKTTLSSSLSFCRLAGVPATRRGLKVAACAVSNKPTGKPRGIMRPRKVSPAMQEVVGMPEVSRTEALKLIWAHIKQNNLQDPDDKRIIVCDEKLKNIFAGKDRIKFLEVQGQAFSVERFMHRLIIISLHGFTSLLAGQVARL
ncbi:hypothetical protein V2J09_021559 [Rumex salicifolius]